MAVKLLRDTEMASNEVTNGVGIHVELVLAVAQKPMISCHAE